MPPEVFFALSEMFFLAEFEELELTEVLAAPERFGLSEHEEFELPEEFASAESEESVLSVLLLLVLDTSTAAISNSVLPTEVKKLPNMFSSSSDRPSAMIKANEVAIAATHFPLLLLKIIILPALCYFRSNTNNTVYAYSPAIHVLCGIIICFYND